MSASPVEEAEGFGAGGGAATEDTVDEFNTELPAT